MQVASPAFFVSKKVSKIKAFGVLYTQMWAKCGQNGVKVLILSGVCRLKPYYLSFFAVL